MNKSDARKTFAKPRKQNNYLIERTNRREDRWEGEGGEVIRIPAINLLLACQNKSRQAATPLHVCNCQNKDRGRDKAIESE